MSNWTGWALIATVPEFLCGNDLRRMQEQPVMNAFSGQMHEGRLMWVGDPMTENFVSEPGEHLPPPKPGRGHVCDGVSFSPFEIYVRQSAG